MGTFLSTIAILHGYWCTRLEMRVDFNSQDQVPKIVDILRAMPRLTHLTLSLWPPFQIPRNFSAWDPVIQTITFFGGLEELSIEIDPLSGFADPFLDLFLKPNVLRRVQCLRLEGFRFRTDREALQRLRLFQGAKLRLVEVYYMNHDSPLILPDNLNTLELVASYLSPSLHLALPPRNLRKLTMRAPNSVSSVLAPHLSSWDNLEELSIKTECYLERILASFKVAPQLRSLELCSLNHPLLQERIAPFLSKDNSGSYNFPSLERLAIQEYTSSGDAIYVSAALFAKTGCAQLAALCTERGIQVERLFNGRLMPAMVQQVRHRRSQNYPR